MSVRVERDGPVTTVILDRPDVRNAVDGPTAAALAERVRRVRGRRRRPVAVLCGAGGTFCAGADLKAIGGPDGNRVEPDGDGPMGPTRMRLSKPVIAAIAGHAVAGGLELALWCDLRVVEEDAVLGVFCRRWGVPLIDGGTVRLPRLVGPGPGAGPDPHRPGGAGRRGAARWAWSSRVVPHGPGSRRPPRRWPGRSPRSRRPACAATAQSALASLSLTETDAMANEFRHGMTALAAPGLADRGRPVPRRRGPGRHAGLTR